MNFKNESHAYLDKVVDMRNELTQQAVNEQIAKVHVPYVTELTMQKDKLIDEAKEEYERNVAALSAALNAKISQLTSETEAAIAAHKIRVISDTESAMKEKYNAFIRSVCDLVDNSGIE